MIGNGRNLNGYGRPPSNGMWTREQSDRPHYGSSNPPYSYREAQQHRPDPAYWDDRSPPNTPRSLSSSEQDRYTPHSWSESISLTSPPWIASAILSAQTNEAVADQVLARKQYVVKKSWDCLSNPRVREKMKANFPRPLPVQELGIAAIQEKLDVVLRVARGYGRSSTWMIPLLDKLMDYNKVPGLLHTLVVAPNDIAAAQIAARLNLIIPCQKDRRLLMPLWCWMEHAKDKCYEELQRLGGSMLITTSSLLPSLLRDAPFPMESLRCIVVDEFDRIPRNRDWINRVHTYMDKNTQAVLVCSPVFKLEFTGIFLQNPCAIVDAQQIVEQSEPTTSFLCIRDNREEELLQIIDAICEKKNKAIFILCYDQQKEEALYKFLCEKGVQRMSWLQRRLVNHDEWRRDLSAFREGRIDVLLSNYADEKYIDTIDQVDVYYDLPPDLRQYEKRLLRNGRVRRGDSITFIDECDLPLLDGLYKILAHRPEAKLELRRIDDELHRMNLLIEDNIIMTQDIERLQGRIKANAKSRVGIEHDIVHLNKRVLDKHTNGM